MLNCWREDWAYNWNATHNCRRRRHDIRDDGANDGQRVRQLGDIKTQQSPLLQLQCCAGQLVHFQWEVVHRSTVVFVEERNVVVKRSVESAYRREKQGEVVVLNDELEEKKRRLRTRSHQAPKRMRENLLLAVIAIAEGIPLRR